MVGRGGADRRVREHRWRPLDNGDMSGEGTQVWELRYGNTGEGTQVREYRYGNTGEGTHVWEYR